MSNVYGDAFSEVFDDLRWSGYSLELARVLLAAFGEDGNGRRVVDLCCGSGHLLEAFSERGFDVTGVDLSQPILDLATRKLARASAEGRARLVCANAATFAPSEEADIVTVANASLHILSRDELDATFRRVHSYLKEDGVFALHAYGQSFFTSHDGEVKSTEGPSGTEVSRCVILDNPYVPGETKFLLWITGYLKRGETYVRYEERTKLIIHDIRGLRKRLQEAGFSTVLLVAWDIAAGGFELVPEDAPEASLADVLIVAGKGEALAERVVNKLQEVQEART